MLESQRTPFVCGESDALLDTVLDLSVTGPMTAATYASLAYSTHLTAAVVLRANIKADSHEIIAACGGLLPSWIASRQWTAYHRDVDRVLDALAQIHQTELEEMDAANVPAVGRRLRLWSRRVHAAALLRHGYPLLQKVGYPAGTLVRELANSLLPAPALPMPRVVPCA